jgi:hypothetical protein
MNASGRRWVGAVVILAAIAGCTQRGVHAGTVTGVARVYGGPPKPNGQMAVDGSPGIGNTLTATQNGRPVASTVTGAAGSYRFTLAPGSYVVTGCQDVTVVVVGGQGAHRDITCAIP